ncbi:MAG: divergent polysaccharide deacetylase family protein, partial [Fibrobacteria bacterium]
MAGPAMGIVRKILIFIVLTAGIILLGKVAPRVFPFDANIQAKKHAVKHTGKYAEETGEAPPPNMGLKPEGLRDSTNALPAVEADTTGGRWHEKLFEPLERGYGLTPKSIKQRKGFWEVIFPKGKPIHEYALQIENLCRANAITVEQGVELRPANRSVEYLLQSNGQRIKLRASLGNAFMAGSARIAIVFLGLDSLDETELAALESAPWDKTLIVDPHCANPVLKKLRFTQARNEVLVELPMEPTSYPFLNPGKHALFIHHSKEDVEKILSGDLDSLPKAAGFASRLGDRAIENQPLLEKLFRYTSAKGLVFLDLTGSPRSLSRQTAAAQGARSRSLTPFKDDAHLEEELAHKSALAQKTGDAILALRYSAAALRNLAKALEAHAIRFNEMGLELVTLSNLVAE